MVQPTVPGIFRCDTGDLTSKWHERMGILRAQLQGVASIELTGQKEWVKHGKTSNFHVFLFFKYINTSRFSPIGKLWGCPSSWVDYRVDSG